MGVVLWRDVRRLQRVFDALKDVDDRPPAMGVYDDPDVWVVARRGVADVARPGVVDDVTRDARCMELLRAPPSATIVVCGLSCRRTASMDAQSARHLAFKLLGWVNVGWVNPG
jgi:hypothetical protein